MLALGLSACGGQDDVTSTAGTGSSSGSARAISQNKFTLTTSAASVEGFYLDGKSVDITVTAFDRYGAGVASGTRVNFLSSHGVVGSFSSTAALSYGVCYLDSFSTCKVQLRSVGARPSNGVVTVIAYTQGEEPYADLNANGKWDAGEPFTDMGAPYLDVNANGTYDPGVDQTVTGAPGGTTACTGTNLAIANTCDGTWTGTGLVRQRASVVWTTSGSVITTNGERTLVLQSVSVLDQNGNQMSPGTTVAAAVVGKSTCEVSNVVVGGSSGSAGTFNVVLNGDAACLSAPLVVTVTSPSGVVTTQYL